MQKSKVKISAWKWQVPRVDKRSARMRSDSVKNMSAYADQNHAPSLAAARLEFQEYGEGENQEFPETDAAMEIVAASVSRLTN